jgi:hypothetical protein
VIRAVLDTNQLASMAIPPGGVADHNTLLTELTFRAHLLGDVGAEGA